MWNLGLAKVQKMSFRLMYKIILILIIIIIIYFINNNN